MAHLKSKSKILVSFCTLFSFAFFFSVHTAAITRKADVAYMLKLRNALTPPPSDWSDNTDICQWSGVSCRVYAPGDNAPHVNNHVRPFEGRNKHYYVDDINLNSGSLTGTLPSGLSSLFHLTSLDLRNNYFFGPLPSLANLTALGNVDLGNNNFTSIPHGCFQGLTGLQNLTLNANVNLAPWTFPDLTRSSQLSTLDLSDTNVMGSLPDIFHHFPQLSYLDLSRNNITGALPNSFAKSSKVDSLFLFNQSYGLSGTIEVLSSMTGLSALWLQGNLFEGPIPDLSHCKSLEDLELQDNRLTGVVPHSLMSLPSLGSVYLENNFLQGPKPVFGTTVSAFPGDNTSNSFCQDNGGPCDQRVTTLLEIAAAFGYPYVLARSWKRNDPCQNWSFVACGGGKIRTMNLTKQNLTGTISPAFGNLTDLWYLYLDGNNLMGSIPESLATLPQLKALDVSNNNLSGNIPKFSSMVVFNASSNAFLRHSQANRTITPADSSHKPSPPASETSLSPSWIAGSLILAMSILRNATLTSICQNFF